MLKEGKRNKIKISTQLFKNYKGSDFLNRNVKENDQKLKQQPVVARHYH